jgi:hypothetical protein
MATEDARSRQSATDHPLARHFATSHVSASTTNSTSQTSPSLIVHATPTTPIRRDRAAQSAQRVCHIPAHTEPLLHRRSHTPARHRTVNARTPMPCTAMHRDTPTAHRFTPRRSKNCRAPAEPPSHRHCPPVPCTQCTTPPRRTAHDTQCHPSPVHPRPCPSGDIKPEATSRILPCRPFVSTPLPFTCRTPLPWSHSLSAAVKARGRH